MYNECKATKIRREQESCSHRQKCKEHLKIVSGTSLEKYEFETQLMLRFHYHNLDF